MRTSPRKIGLLGDISWHSTLDYERLLHEGVAAALPDHTADLVIRHYDFGAIGQAQAAGDWDGLGRQLAADARWLVDGGAEAILICANTMHLAAPAVEQAVDVPVIHIVDEAAKAIRAAGLDTVALLGTGFTMRMPFYRDRMALHGVITIVPEEPDLQAIHDLIYTDLTRGVVTAEGRALATPRHRRRARARRPRRHRWLHRNSDGHDRRRRRRALLRRPRAPCPGRRGIRSRGLKTLLITTYRRVYGCFAHMGLALYTTAKSRSIVKTRTRGKGVSK